MTKLVYKDDANTKVLRGDIISEDEVFVTFKTLDDTVIRINKKSIVTIKEGR